MKTLTDNDLTIFAKKMSLSKPRAAVLFETPTDLNLVIDSLSSKFSQKSASSLSVSSYYKVAVFKHSIKKNFLVDEKSYVADTISNILPLLAKTGRIKALESGRFNEKTAQYYLLLCSLDRKVKKFKEIDSFFRSHDKRELANHLDEWANIINEIKSAGWLTKFENSVIKGNEKKSLTVYHSSLNT